MHHMTRDGVGASQQLRHFLHLASVQRFPHRRTGDTQTSHLVAVHTGHVKAVGRTCSVEHGVVPCAFRAKTEVVSHQDVFRTQTFE